MYNQRWQNTIFQIRKESKLIRSNLDIFDNVILYSAYADYTTFFLKYVKSVMKLFDTIDCLSTYSAFKFKCFQRRN